MVWAVPDDVDPAAFAVAAAVAAEDWSVTDEEDAWLAVAVAVAVATVH